VNEIVINELKMYSPPQVFIGSLFCGPLSMLYFIWKNFKTMGQSQKAKYTIIYGVLFLFALIGCLQLVPTQINPLIPGMITPFLYSLAAYQIVNSLQMEKDAIQESTNYSTQSNWRVAAYGVTLYLAWIAITFSLQQF
jgi:hypothetical protein